MVVGHDIAVRANDDAGTRTLALLLASLGLALVAEEEAEERIDHILLLILDGNFDIHYRLDGMFCGISEIRIVRQ